MCPVPVGQGKQSLPGVRDGEIFPLEHVRAVRRHRRGRADGVAGVGHPHRILGLIPHVPGGQVLVQGEQDLVAGGESHPGVVDDQKIVHPGQFVDRGVGKRLQGSVLPLDVDPATGFHKPPRCRNHRKVVPAVVPGDPLQRNLRLSGHEITSRPTKR